jgi:hypothetical protein
MSGWLASRQGTGALASPRRDPMPRKQCGGKPAISWDYLSELRCWIQLAIIMIGARV